MSSMCRLNGVITSYSIHYTKLYDVPAQVSATLLENSRQAATWSWAAADADTLVKTPKEMLPEDLNVRATATYEAESAKCKGAFTKVDRITSYNVCYTKLLRGRGREPTAAGGCHLPARTAR